jgi:hypothetical protein
VHHLERTSGRPAVALVSSTFSSQAIHQAEALGLSQPERHIVLAEHPISDASVQELGAKAELLYADLRRQLTTNVPCSEARRRRLRAAEPSALCAAGA